MKQAFALINKRLMATFPCDHADNILVGEKQQWGKCKTCGEVFRASQLDTFKYEFESHGRACVALEEIEKELEYVTEQAKIWNKAFLDINNIIDPNSEKPGLQAAIDVMEELAKLRKLSTSFPTIGSDEYYKKTLQHVIQFLTEVVEAEPNTTQGIKKAD